MEEIHIIMENLSKKRAGMGAEEIIKEINGSAAKMKKRIQCKTQTNQISEKETDSSLKSTRVGSGGRIFL